ncbi:unnamed protein product, partial [Brenthis ino]
MAWQRALSSQEILSILEEEKDLEDANQIDAVYIPPTVDNLTDEEDLDDDALGDYENTVPTDIAETYEIHTDLPAEPENTQGEPGPSTSKKPRLPKKSPKYVPDWKKEHPIYTHFPTSDETAMTQNIEERVGGKTPFEVFSLFFSDEVWEQIVGFSKKYACDHNRHLFTLTVAELKRFFGILLLTGYHSLPAAKLYWSKDEDKNVSIVRNCMSRNKFDSIKENIHLCDNTDLHQNDKFAKLRPIFNIINQKNMQFGIFSHNLSIDEEMVPYFGRHGCKMFIKGKPIRFGFKLWCLCSSNGYLYQFIPYGGKNSNVTRNDLGLGENIVLDLLSVIEDPRKHRIFFDNFFSSHKLFSILKEKGYFATGTIRENRTMNKNLINTKSLQKKERGSFDYNFDQKYEVLLVRWNDNSVVNVATNNAKIEPLVTAKRYDRKIKKMVNVPQPQVIADYNKNMGGVDLHDNGIANYRIQVRGKKWWWPLFINLIDSVLVNSWKIYNLANERSLSQLEFKSYVTVSLMKTEEAQLADNSHFLGNSNINLGRPSKNALPTNIRFDNIGHVIGEQESKRRRRCRQCRSTTIYMCKKCQVHLHADCFKIFHSR